MCLPEAQTFEAKSVEFIRFNGNQEKSKAPGWLASRESLQIVESPREFLEILGNPRNSVNISKTSREFSNISPKSRKFWEILEDSQENPPRNEKV